MNTLSSPVRRLLAGMLVVSAVGAAMAATNEPDRRLPPDVPLCKTWTCWPTGISPDGGIGSECGPYDGPGSCSGNGGGKGGGTDGGTDGGSGSGKGGKGGKGDKG